MWIKREEMKEVIEKGGSEGKLHGGGRWSMTATIQITDDRSKFGRQRALKFHARRSHLHWHLPAPAPPQSPPPPPLGVGKCGGDVIG